MKHRLVLLGCALAVASSACGGGKQAEPKPETPVAYKRVFIQDETRHYRYTSTVSGTSFIDQAIESITAEIKIDFTERTTGVDAAGMGTVKFIFEDVSLTVNGVKAPIPLKDKLSLTAQYQTDGTLVSLEGIDGLGLSSDLGPIGDLFGPIAAWPLFAGNPVQPGDSWRSAPPLFLKLFDQALGGTVNSTLSSLEDVDGVEAAVIASGTEIPIELRLSGAELLEYIQRQTGQKPSDEDFPFPPKAVFTYGGTQRLQLEQRVTTATGRLLESKGTGSATLQVRLEGFGPVPPYNSTFTSTVNLKLLDSVSDLPTPGTAPRPTLSA